MPTASDGKEFPYTPEGIKAHKKYEANLNRKNKSMGKDNKKDSWLKTFIDSRETKEEYIKRNSLF